jgi:hypothetical protein
MVAAKPQQLYVAAVSHAQVHATCHHSDVDVSTLDLVGVDPQVSLRRDECLDLVGAEVSALGLIDTVRRFW